MNHRTSSSPTSTFRVACLCFIGTVISTTAALAAAVPTPPAWGAWNTWGDQGDGTYRNPVLPADYSDIDCIRVGSDYYAISSTFQFSPGMVVLRSKDLVNWTPIGHAVADLRQISPALNWDQMDRYNRGVWAGAIRHHGRKFWVYFGTPDEGYFVTTATDPAGPWEPLTHVLKEAGWDDCCPFWDDDGQGYLLGTRFAEDPKDGTKYKIHLWKLSADGKAVIRESDTVLYQARGSEANKLFKHQGTYYHYFSEVRPEGRVPMIGRAKSITGPYERRQVFHVNKEADREPNQGGIIQSESGEWWFFTHHGSGTWEGRSASLLPVTWVDGWPIPGKAGPDGIGNMVWSGLKPVAAPMLPPGTSDEFSSGALPAYWEWNYQPRPDKWSLTVRRGFLRLHAFRGLDGDNLLKIGNVLTQRSWRSARCEFTTRVDLSGMADGQHAGIVHFSSARNQNKPAANSASIGVVQRGMERFIEYSRDGTFTRGATLAGPVLFLRSTWSLEGKSQFSYSTDGVTFTDFGAPYPLQWGSYRGDRIGLFTYNNTAQAGHVDFDSATYAIQRTVGH